MALGRLAHDQTESDPNHTQLSREGIMQEINLKRRNRVFKSLHKPLTYLGVERTVFYFVCVGAVGVFNLFESLLAGIVVFIGGFIFGRWATNADPAMLRILAQSERFKTRYDAAKQDIPLVEVR
ncbi:MAG: VirB3 family type IV secretion system protein [Acidobacteriia bacterium]|nr:VirB3 family type IV secretion system protein [Terriglobia bacterium]